MQHFLQFSEGGLAHHRHHPPYLNEIEDLRDGLVADISPAPMLVSRTTHTVRSHGHDADGNIRFPNAPAGHSRGSSTNHRSSRYMAVPSFDRVHGCQTTGAPISMACRLAGSVHFIRYRSTASLPSAAVTVS